MVCSERPFIVGLPNVLNLCLLNAVYDPSHAVFESTEESNLKETIILFAGIIFFAIA